jgi:hypothetical protein
MENRSLSELVAAVRAEERLWIRLAGNCVENWRLALLEITAGAKPPLFGESRWLYAGAAFIAQELPGASVADWLDQQRITAPPLELEIADLPPTVHVERRDSGFAGSLSPLLWPSEIWTLSLPNQYTHQYRGDLVAGDAPPFLDFDQAAAAFFGLPPSFNRSFSGREVVFRAQDLRARITSVRIRPAQVVVSVDGDSLPGATVAIGGDQPGPRAPVHGAGDVQLPLSHALPSRPWVALHLDKELLDRRYLDASSAQPGVEVEVDAATRLAVLITGGEGPTIEFKRELPGTDPRAAMKTVAAFANGGGGTIAFGVNDEGAVIGLNEPSLRKSADRLTNLIRDYVHPLPLYEIDVLEAEQVLLVDVQASPLTPYGVGTDEREVVYYLRRGANSFPATPADVRLMVHAREPVADRYNPLPFR